MNLLLKSSLIKKKVDFKFFLFLNSKKFKMYTVSTVFYKENIVQEFKLLNLDLFINYVLENISIKAVKYL